ncbi:MAG TPA: cation diffusion facilitator family transporter [Pyrinomonadaceae bacterium]|jgi:ferrous-iron efflux pump FieF|nr:cation diffusion facilitator family transporter [Pyrinomonadaceae bacterium]
MTPTRTTTTVSRESAHTAREEAAKISVARLSMLAAGFLILLKTATGFLTGSISVWASLIDSAMDIFASAINLVAVRAAARPADEDHAYGHGKAESLAGLFQSLVIAASGAFLIYEAIRRLVEPHATSQEWIGIMTMLVAIIVSVALVRRLRRVARETESLALASDAIHYASDIFTNSGALLALLIVVLTGWQMADPLISIMIAIYILWSAAAVGREAMDVLMDRRLPIDIDERIAAVINRYREQGVLGFHDLRTRRSGSQKFIDLHLEVERDKRLEEAHDLTVQVLRAIEADIPRSRVHIHTDPG